MDYCFQHAFKEELDYICRCNIEISSEFDRTIGGRDNLDLWHHTLSVWKAFEYFFLSSPPHGLIFSIEKLRMMILLHDIGKPEAVAQGDPERQHEITTRFFEMLSPSNQMPGSYLDDLLSVVSIDPIGKYLNKKHSKPLERSLSELVSLREKLGCSRKKTWELVSAYYQSDVCGHPSLRLKVFGATQLSNIEFGSTTLELLHHNDEERTRYSNLRSSFLEQ